jgi:acyl dehydratase
MTGTERPASEWIGHPLGKRVVAWSERDAILYSLAVGAKADELDLVFEERLRPLPTFALTLAQWAPDALGSLRAFEPGQALHGSQRLEVLEPLPAHGELTMTADVEAVWDKGSAAVFDVRVESRYFLARWSIFAPGRGGFGGDRGPASAVPTPDGDELTVAVETFAEQAALYRLCGDRHTIHIDPVAARAIGQPRPILHGLCTLAASAMCLARALGVHPADLRELEGRFTAPVLPGDTLDLQARASGTAAGFAVARDGQTVIAAGHARFG